MFQIKFLFSRTSANIGLGRPKFLIDDEDDDGTCDSLSRSPFIPSGGGVLFQASAPYSIELNVGAPNLTNIRYAEGEMVKNALQMLTVMA